MKKKRGRGRNQTIEESSRDHSSGRNLFVPIITTLVTGPISLIVGFYLGHALQRPHLSIVDHHEIVYSESHKLPESLLQEITSQPLLVAIVRETLMRAVNQGEDPCTAWLDREPWKDQCIESVLAAARGLSTSLLAQSVMPLPKLLESMRYSPEETKALGTSLARLIDQLENFRTDESKQLTGEVVFEVGILNTGDFDGVISKDGKLVSKDGEFLISADEYTVVKAHGFQTVKFSESGWTTEPERKAWEAWRKHVKASQNVRFHIVLKSGAKKNISSEEITLDLQ
jgi:hypothetical protein